MIQTMASSFVLLWFSLSLMEANTRYCPAQGSFTALSEVCPFFVRDKMMHSNKTASDLEEPLCYQDFAISK